VKVFSSCFIQVWFIISFAELCVTQNIQAQKSRVELLEDFKGSGDVQLLTNLWRTAHGLESGIDFNITKKGSSSSEVIEKLAEFNLQVLAAIGKRQRLLAVERQPVAKTLIEFGDEMRLRKDQPFITPGTTKAEEIPDLQYRQRYIKYLSAREVDMKHAEIAGILASLDTSFRSDVISSLESLSDANRRQLLDRVAPETISTETVKILTDRFKIPFVYKDRKPVLLEK
jgi:hypothetical protein